ncbi:12275_t:CDS:2, partial [Cetraspora pellucida]
NHDNSSTEILMTSGFSNHVIEIPESSSESIPIESQVSNSSSSKPSQENDQDESKTRSFISSKLSEAEINASTEETESRVSDSANSETEIKTYPVCNEEYKDDNISGEWSSSNYYSKETYYLYCGK